MTLRHYQTKALNNCRDAYGQGARSVLLVMPTGAGKTMVMATAADGVSRRGKTSGIIMHRQELIMQTSLTLARMKIYHSLVAPDSITREAIKAQMQELGASYFHREAPVNVCSIQTLVRREDVRFGFLFWDECHHCAAGSYAKVEDRHKGAHQLGVTATPERLDGKGLGREHGGPFDVMVEGPAASWLMAEGYLTRAEVWGASHQLDFSEVATTRSGDFREDEAAALVDKPTITGDAIAHYSKICPNQPAIAFCINIEHAQGVARDFRAAGYRATCVDGNMPDSERRAAIRALAEGRLDVLTSCEIINEGTDVPVVTSAILLRPTQSLGLHLQQIGRVLRPVYAPGFDLSTTEGRLDAIAMSDKPRAIILDHVGNCIRHGFAEDERQWSLAGRQKKKRSSNEPPVPAARRCSSCYAVFRSSLPACPACGTRAELTRREIEYREGELVRMEREDAERLRREKYWADRRSQAAAKTMEDLIAQNMARGMSYGKARARAQYILAAREAKANNTPTMV